MGATGVAGGSGHRRLDDVVLRRSLLAAGFGVVVTVLILLTPYLSFGVRSSSAHLALNAVDAFVALLVAYLLHGRFLRSRRWRDALLSQALVLLAISGLGLDLLSGLGDENWEDLWVWTSLAVRLIGAACFLVAALAGERPAPRARHPRWSMLPLVAGVALVIAVLVLVRSWLPEALPHTNVPESAERPLLTGHPLLLLAQGLSAAAFAMAAVLFTVRGSRSDDELLRWLGPACALGAFARLNYLFFPSLYTEWLYTGDVLRTSTYLLLLVGAAREIRQYWAAQSALAIAEDRRRQARELHDGVVQELGYIRGEAGLLATEASHRIVAACDRALDEARAVVHLLDSEPHESLSETLRRSLLQLSERYTLDLALDLDPRVQADGEQRHALLRIAREAVGNAARHSNAHRVRVALRAETEARTLTVTDDGLGFDLGAARARGTTYGLTSMCERARGLPGRLEIDSTPERGTTVRVTW